MTDAPLAQRSVDDHLAPNAGSFVELYDECAPYSAFRSEVRAGGTFGLSVMDVRQGVVESVDPALPEFAFVSVKAGGGRGEFDFGDGWKDVDFRQPSFDVQPARTQCRFRLPDLHLRIGCVPESAIIRLLDEMRLGTQALDGVSGRMHAVPQAAQLMDVIWHVTRRPNAGTNLVVDGALLQIIGHLLVAAGHPACDTPAAALGDHRLARAIDYLETHLASPLTVGQLAGVAAMSTSAFARAFRTATGRSVWTYVQQRRVERAYAMILHTKLPLAHIAADCGFSDAAHLSRTFRAIHGHAPSELR